MFSPDPHFAQRINAADCEEIARFAEKHGVTVSFDPLGLKLHKKTFTLSGVSECRKLIPWIIFVNHVCPAVAIKTDIQTLDSALKRAVAEHRASGRDVAPEVTFTANITAESALSAAG